MKEKKFRIGDRVTYKNKIDFTSCLGTPNSYYNGGIDHGGFMGVVTHYLRYVDEKGCYEIEVSTDPSLTDAPEYSMLESEFFEYDNEHPVYDGFRIRHKFI